MAFTEEFDQQSESLLRTWRVNKKLRPFRVTIVVALLRCFPRPRVTATSSFHPPPPEAVWMGPDLKRWACCALANMMSPGCTKQQVFYFVHDLRLLDTISGLLQEQVEAGKKTRKKRQKIILALFKIVDAVLYNTCIMALKFRET